MAMSYYRAEIIQTWIQVISACLVADRQLNCFEKGSGDEFLKKVRRAYISVSEFLNRISILQLANALRKCFQQHA